MEETERILQENRDWIEEIWRRIVTKLRRTSVTCRDKLPGIAADGVYDDRSKGTCSSWMNGFWPGIMWLMYAATGEDCFRITAETGETSLDRALAHYACLHHDVGFMWQLSSGADYKLTGSEASKNRNLHAAATLASRYQVNGGFIRAWNDPGTEGWAIIDSMMNLPLLYWAAETTGNDAFRQIAMRHADKTLANHLRPDGSVYHIIDYDVNTGESKGAAPHTQGYDAEHSSWSRGQAWAIYGFVLSFIHTGEQRYLDAAKRASHYFIAAVSCTGDVPVSDFRAPDQGRLDASAGAIAACGLIEIANSVPELEKTLYLHAAIRILRALSDAHCDWTDANESILQDTTGSYGDLPSVNRAYIFGDYFFVEAIYKLKGFPVLFW